MCRRRWWRCCQQLSACWLMVWFTEPTAAKPEPSLRAYTNPRFPRRASHSLEKKSDVTAMACVWRPMTSARASGPISYPRGCQSSRRRAGLRIGRFHFGWDPYTPKRLGDHCGAGALNHVSVHLSITPETKQGACHAPAFTPASKTSACPAVAATPTPTELTQSGDVFLGAPWPRRQASSRCSHRMPSADVRDKYRSPRK